MAISNCVIDLPTDKPAVLAEMFHVLGGRIGITDVVAEDHLTPADGAIGHVAGRHPLFRPAMPGP